MKWTFAIKFFEIQFVLWCCVVTNAKNSGPMKDGSSALGLTIGCVIAAVLVVIVVGLVVVLYKRRKSRYEDLPAMSMGIAKSVPKDRNTVSKRAVLVKKTITADGGVIEIDDIILKIGPGCLDKDTEITLINNYTDIANKSLLDLDLLDACLRVVEFLPDGLKFLKPADLTIRFEETVSDSELFILHSSHNHDYQRTAWELGTDGINENNVKGLVNTKINGFCFYSYILAMRGRLGRILSHLNHSFTCRAYALHRRSFTVDAIDIAVVIVSEFADENEEEDIKQLKDLLDFGYVKGEKGLLKRVHINRPLEMSLHFPGVENTPFSFNVDAAKLDSVGFVIDHFQEIAVKSPARGAVRISEVHRNAENELLWMLNVREMDEESTLKRVMYRTTKLTNGEICRMSSGIGVDWDNLAVLLDIPYSEREEIRVNEQKFPDNYSKTQQIFKLFNDNKFFDRYYLQECFEELGQHDLKNGMLPVENENDEEETLPSQFKVTEGESELKLLPPEKDILDIHLSPLEISRLSRRITVDWDSLAGLMDIAREERNDIRQNPMYRDHRQRAEKILSLFNHKRDFSREKLAECLKGIGKDELISPIKTGQWRRIVTQGRIVYRTTKLTNGEIRRMSRRIGFDWDSLAGLLDIPYSEREEIRVNLQKFPGSFSKAEQILELFNDSKFFDRYYLQKCLEELGRHDLKNEMLPVENETRTPHNEAETQPEVNANENVELRNTPLSSCEMYRLSQCITVDWDSLAGLMDIGREERNSIRNSTLYHDDRARAEKILSMFNHKKGFTRKKLIKCLKGIKKLDLINPVVTGQWRRIDTQSRTVSKRPGLVKKIITADGGVIDIDDIILEIGPGCLTKDTEITLRNSHTDIADKSLLDLGLIDAAPRVVEFLPDGLKFLKPADLTIRFQNTVSNTEIFILHCSYNLKYQKTVWELGTTGIEERNVKGVVNTKINGFSFYMFVLATRGMLARILSHLNQSFICRAYALYRRSSTVGAIDISVVILSEFVDENEEEDIKQLKDHLDLGYVKGEKGLLKRVYTDRRLEMSLDFPGVENTPFSFIVDQSQLDSVGFVIDHFHEIVVKSPASGKVKIREVDRSIENESLWRINICEIEEEIRVEVVEVQDTVPDPQPEVVYRTTKLTNGEITQLSGKTGLDWDSLAGLMDIPYSDREEIRVDHLNYLSIRSKAKKVFELFNDSTFSDRHILVKYFKELGRHDLENEMLPVEDQNGSEEVETSPTPPVITEEDLLHTPLSPREMSRLARRIVVEWDHLAGLMDIPRAERDDIRYSLIYNDNRSRAEKILTIFNNKEDFSREKLARCLKEIQQLDLIKPVITGGWRNV